jgi:hypothetical protein
MRASWPHGCRTSPTNAKCSTAFRSSHNGQADRPVILQGGGRLWRVPPSTYNTQGVRHQRNEQQGQPCRRTVANQQTTDVGAATPVPSWCLPGVPTGMDANERAVRRRDGVHLDASVVTFRTARRCGARVVSETQCWCRTATARPTQMAHRGTRRGISCRSSPRYSTRRFASRRAVSPHTAVVEELGSFQKPSYANRNGGRPSTKQARCISGAVNSRYTQPQRPSTPGV